MDSPITVLTPLIPKASSRTYSTCTLQALVLTISAATLVCVIYYIGPVSPSKPSNIKATALFDHHQTESKKDVDEVTIYLHPDDIYYLESLDRKDSEWNDYHRQIIEANGYDYDPLDESILYSFTMHDYHYDKEHYYNKYVHVQAHHFHEGTHEPTQATARTLRPTNNFTPRPTNTLRPTNTARPTNDFTPRPTLLKTLRPTVMATPRPTVLKTLRPTVYKTLHPTIDWTTTSQHVSIGGLACYAKYSLNENLNINGYVLTCNSDKDTLVGCVAGSGHRTKDKRSGEKAVIHGCIANGEAIYIRCCHPQDPSVHMIQHVSEITYAQNPNFPVYSSNSYCHSTDIGGFKHAFDENENVYMVGCTGWTGISSPFNSSEGIINNTQTQQMIGTKIGATGRTCTAHRGDERGFIAAAAIVVGLDNAELECVLVQSTLAREPKNLVVNGANNVPEWAAMAFCHEGYSLMDCSGYIEGLMDDCSSESDGDAAVGAVLFHGTDLRCMADREQHCSANGNTDRVRVQANCCKIVQRNLIEEEYEGQANVLT